MPDGQSARSTCQILAKVRSSRRPGGHDGGKGARGLEGQAMEGNEAKIGRGGADPNKEGGATEKGGQNRPAVAWRITTKREM